MVTSPNSVETHHIHCLDLQILYHWTFVKYGTARRAEMYRFVEDFAKRVGNSDICGQ